MTEIRKVGFVESIPFPDEELSACADFLQRQRLRVEMNRFEDVFTGNGDFAETELYSCGLLVAIAENGNWAFRHIANSSEDYVNDAAEAVVKAIGQEKNVEYKFIAGSAELTGKVVNSLFKMGKEIKPGNFYVETGSDEETDSDFQHKKVLFFKGNDHLTLLLEREKTILHI